MKLDEVVSKYVSSGVRRNVILTSFANWVLVSYGVMLMTFTLPAIIKEFSLSTMEASTLASSTFVGMLVGALSSGFVADILGRRVAVLFYYSISLVFTLLFGLANSFMFMLSWRLLSGIGYGGLMPAVNAYMAEYMPSWFRGRSLVLLESMWAVGSVMVGLVDLILGELNWRYDYHFILVFLVFLPWIVRLSESPRYAFLRGGKRALERVLNLKLRDDVEKLEDHGVPFSALFRREYIRSTLVIWSVWFSLSLIYYGIFIWLPKIFALIGVELVKTRFFTFLMMVAQLPGYLSAAYLIEKLGRKGSLSLYLLGTGISTLMFAVSREQSWILISALITSFFCLGAWGILYAYTPEVFPTSFRGTANGTSGVMARVAGIIAPYITALFVSEGDIVKALVFFSALSLTIGFVVKFLGVETLGRDIG